MQLRYAQVKLPISLRSRLDCSSNLLCPVDVVNANDHLHTGSTLPLLLYVAVTFSRACPGHSKTHFVPQHLLGVARRHFPLDCGHCSCLSRLIYHDISATAVFFLSRFLHPLASDPRTAEWRQPNLLQNQLLLLHQSSTYPRFSLANIVYHISRSFIG